MQDYEKIMRDITSGMTGDSEKDIAYLIKKQDEYQNHELKIEITRAIGRMMYEIAPKELLDTFNSELQQDQLTLHQLYEEANYQIYMKNYNKAMDLLKVCISRMEEFPFNHDSVSEYYSFFNYFEGILYKKLTQSTRKFRAIPDNYAAIYLTYGALLVEIKEYEKAEKALESALIYNPIYSEAMFELGEVYKMNNDMEKYFNLAKRALKSVYSRKNLARCYRNIGYYLVEKMDYSGAIAAFYLSTHYENAPIAMSELHYISVITKQKIEPPTYEEIKKCLEPYDIEMGASPLVWALAYHLGNHLFEEKNYEASLFLYRIVNDLDPHKDFEEKIKLLEEITNSQEN